jgi:hypothetical protein
MLDALSNKFSDLVKSLSGKSKISEQNIEETVEQIKVALLEADVTSGSSGASLIIPLKKPRARRSFALSTQANSSSRLFTTGWSIY